MSDFNNEHITSSETDVQTREETPVYSSRLEKYHQKKTKQKKTVADRKIKKSGLVTAEDLDIPASDNSVSDAEKSEFEAVTPIFAENETDGKRSSEAADPNIRKLIDLDEGEYTNRLKKTKEKKGMPKAAKAWLIALLCVGIAICLVLVFVVELVSIEGQSMEPTLYGGEKIVADKISRYFKFPDRGQVVVTKYDGYDGYYVKRIIAFPGEWVEIYDNTVYVNGEKMDESYVYPNTVYENMPLMQVPEGHVFLMGDNRAQSLDSRMDSIGPVDADNIIGNACWVILPFDKVREIN